MNNSQIGGQKGREEGLLYEKLFDLKMNQNNNFGYWQLLKQIYKTNFNKIKDIYSLLVSQMTKKNWNILLSFLKEHKKWLYNYLITKQYPIDDKRAADCIIFVITHDDTIFHLGLDIKKPCNQTQLMSKSINNFLLNNLNINEQIIRSLNYYISYNDKKRYFNKNNENIEQIKNDLFQFVNSIKKEIKKRFDPNNLYHNDIIISEKNKKIKYIFVDDLINKIIQFKNMILKNSNFSFNNYLTIKPHGSSNPKNFQFMLNSKIFDSSYSFDLIIHGNDDNK
jgi:hypothetical protein